MNFKIDKQTLSNFLAMCQLQGTIENKDVLLEVSPTYISSRAISRNKSVLLKTKMTGIFADLDKIGLQNLPAVKGYLSAGATGQQIELDKLSDNKLQFKYGRTKFTANIVKAE